MSNQAKDIEQGIGQLGDKITFSRTGFRRPVTRPEVANSVERVGESTVLLTEPVQYTPPPQLEVTPLEQPTPIRTIAQPVPQQAPQPPEVIEVKEPSTQKLYDRITFEITPEQRAVLTNIATTLNSRVPKAKRERKINRDMLMRAILSVAEELPWEDSTSLLSEEDISLFVKKQFRGL